MGANVIAPMSDEHVNVTPLIDVVMCLIIFFLLVGQMARDQAPPMNLPQITCGASGQEAADQNRLILNVLPGNPAPAVCLGDSVVAPGRLADLLRSQRALRPDVRIQLRADSSIEYQFIGPILNACAGANIHSVDLVARQRIAD